MIVKNCFTEWFNAQGYDEQHRQMFMIVWDAAIEAAKEEMEDGQEWILEELKQ